LYYLSSSYVAFYYYYDFIPESNNLKIATISITITTVITSATN